MDDVIITFTLLEMIETVPQVLRDVASAVGVKVLRLVCKAARVLALRAVQGYCLRLIPMSPEDGLPPGLAALLAHTQLQCLRVEIDIGRGMGEDPTAHQLSAQAGQTELFTSLATAALKSVSRMEIILLFRAPSCDSGNEYQQLAGHANNVTYIHDLDTDVPDIMSTDSGCKIMTLLVEACPHVCELSAGGGLGERALSILGAGWSKLTTLIILNASIAFKHSESLQQQHFVFPRLTHLHPSWTAAGQVKLIFRLFACPSLTHISVRKGWFGKDKDWFEIPRHVKVLDCAQLLFPSCSSFPAKLRLDCLECIQLSQISCVPVGVAHLAALLTIAPSLSAIKLRCPSWEGATVIINDSSALLLNDMYSVHERMLAGLKLVNLTLDCTCKVSSEDSDRLICMEQLLITMPHFPLFKSLSLTSQQKDSRCGCLSAIHTAFPALETLSLGGPWIDSDFQDLHGAVLMFTCMRSLQLMASDLTSASLCRIVACMPGLTHLDLSSTSVKSGWKGFQAQLRLSQITGVLELEDSKTKLGDWTLQFKDDIHMESEGSGGFTTWRRIRARVAVK